MSNIARFTSLALAALVALACFSVPPTADAQVEGNPPAVVLTPAIQGSSRGLPEEPGVDRSRYHHIPLLWAEGCRFEKYSPEQEIIERRKGTSKAFDNGDGTETAIIGIAPIHYQDEEGLWQEIGTEIVPNSSGKHSAFEHAVVENRHQVYLDGENSGGYLVEVDGGEILFGTESVIHLEADDGTILATVPRASVPGIVESSTLRYPGSYPQLAAAEELLIQRRVVKHTIVLEERPALFDAHPAARNFVLREWVQLPSGWTVVLGLNPDEVASGNSASQLQIVDQEGRHKASIPTPVFMENEPRADQAAGPEGERIPGQIEKGQGTYRVQPSPGGVFIDTVVPMEWLRNEDRRFPVLIDPTIEVLVPGSTDFAGYIADNGNWCSTGWPDDGDPVWASGGQIGAASPDDQQRAWFRFLVNMIPQSSVIIDTDLTIQFASSNWPYLNFTAISNTNNISCALRYYEIGTGVYATHNCPSGTTTGNVTTDLGASADADLQDSLADGAFGIGIHEFEDSSQYFAEIYSWGSNWIQEPYIEVCYTPPSVTRVAWVANPNSTVDILDVEACDTVYCRVEAVGYTEVIVEVHQDDCNACCDSIVVAAFPVQIDSATGFGTAQWEAVWNNAAQDYFLRVEDTLGNYLACSCFWCDLDVNDTNPPSCPSLQSPGDGATFPWNQPQINFSWSLNPGPGCASGFAQYRFRLSRNADLSAPLQEFDTTNTSAAFAGLGPGDWYWGVNAQDDADNWNWASCGSRLFSLDVIDAGIQLDPVMPDPVSAGCTLLISYSVTNTGNTDHEFDIGCTITGPNNFLVNLPAPMITLNAGDTSSGEIPYTIPPAPLIGIWQATVAVWESQAGAGVNLDSAQDSFQVQPAMTTATIAISPPVSPDPTVPGQTITIPYVVENTGNVCEEQLWIGCTVQGPGLPPPPPPGQPSPTDYDLPPIQLFLNPNTPASGQFTFSLPTAPPTGVTWDPSETWTAVVAVWENCGATCTGQYDIAYDPFDVLRPEATIELAFISPDPVSDGEDVLVNYRVTNTGTLPWDNFHVGFTVAGTNYEAVLLPLLEAGYTYDGSTVLPLSQMNTGLYEAVVAVWYDHPDYGDTWLANDSSQFQYCEDSAAESGAGTTVITHGFLIGSSVPLWAVNMAEAVRNRTGLAGTTYEYDPATGRWNYLTGSGMPDEEIVLIFNWAQESDAANFGENQGLGRAAADALYAALADPHLQDNPCAKVLDHPSGAGRRVHFIGHSRGACVNSEVVRRLVLEGRRVDQLTSIDPHPVNWGTCPADDWMDPWPQWWRGISYADNYWRSDGFCSGTFQDLDFNGYSLDLFDNRNLAVLKTTGACGSGGGCIECAVEHTKTHIWYHGTVDLNAEDDGDCVTVWIADNRVDWYSDGTGESEGYFSSAVVGGFREASVSGILPERPPTLINGDFQFGEDALAGWRFHGGNIEGYDIAENSSSGEIWAELRLGIGPSSPSITHNRFWLSPFFSHLKLKYRLDADMFPHRFRIALIDDQDREFELINQSLLPNAFNAWEEDLIQIPPELRGRTYRLIFELVDNSGLNFPNLDIDDIRFVRETNLPPTIESFTSINSPVQVGELVELAATGVADEDGCVDEVLFEHSDDNGDSWSTLGSTVPTTDDWRTGDWSIDVSGLSAGTHLFKVVARDNEDGERIDEIMVMVDPPPPPPTDPCEPLLRLACSADIVDVTLTWSLPAGGSATYDIIEIRRDGNLISTLFGTVTSYTDTNLSTGWHNYQVQPVCFAPSSAAPIATCNVEIEYCPPVTDFLCEENTTGAVDLSWTLPASDVTAIDIYVNGNILVDDLPGYESNFVHINPGTGTQDYEIVVQCADSIFSVSRFCILNRYDYFLRGDCEKTGSINISDAIQILYYSFVPGFSVPACLRACDSNGDDGVDIADAVFLLDLLFADGSSPPEPYPDCGQALQVDALECGVQQCQP